MFDQLDEIEQHFLDLEKKLADPDIISDQKKYQAIISEHTELKEIVSLYHQYNNINHQIQEAKELLEDPECKDLAQQEIESLKPKLEHSTQALKQLLVPKDPKDKKNAIVEIRSGTGGDEAALFAEDLYRMYSRYAEKKGWSLEILSQNISDLGGLKEISFVLKGNNVFQFLKYESGTHRVQRVPKTETQGRIHTSAATVAILAEADDIDIKINTKDLRIDTFRASGAGGQHVNKTSSAIRIVHLPSNTVVECQDERSQFQNKDKAMRILRSRLLELEEKKQKEAHSESRKQQVGSGDRSEKIRTYNFPQGRVTDHRAGLTVHSLSKILDGELEDFLQKIIQFFTLDDLTQQDT